MGLSDRSMHSLDTMPQDINTGSTIIRPEDFLTRGRPTTTQAAFAQARQWVIMNWFVSEVIKLKLSFYNYGFKITSEEKGKHAKVADYLNKNRQVRRAVGRYVREVWREWLTLNNVVSFWREEAKDSFPSLLPPEKCRYVDAMGTPRLWTVLDYEKKDAPPGTEKRILDRYFTRKEFELDADNWDEHFDVLTTQRRGQGFGMPDLYTLFRTLTQVESMEIGEIMLALAGRRVVHLHRLGFEQKGQQPSKYQQKHSLWSKDRSKKILDFTNGRFGFMETTVNFDQQWEVFLGDGGPKSYDEKKWGTVIRRMMWWGGPLAFMMVANSMNPFLLGMLKTSATSDREEVGEHLNLVLNSAFKFPVPVKVTFSNRCFIDPRLAWDMVNSLLKQGPLSATTAVEQADFNPEQEVERKRAEAANEDDYQPVFNPGGQDGGDGQRGPKTKKEESTTKRSGATSGAK